MSNGLAYAERWRKRAEELRTIADDMTDASARRSVLRAANGYDLLAEGCERRHKGAGSKRGAG